jgi:hypothetical protein
MHFLFNLLRNQGLYMFQALPAAIPEDKQVMLETCRGPDFLIN